MTNQNELKIGAPDWSQMYLISQVVSKRADAKVQFALPGDVMRVGDFFAVGLIPSARIVIPGPARSEWRAAVVSLGEYSSDYTEEVMADWEAKADSGPVPQRFEVLVDGGDLTYSGLLDRGSEAAGGCGCGGGCGCDGSRKDLPLASMQFALHYAGRKPSLVSAPVRARLSVRTVTILASLDQTHWHPFHFDCHSHWYREPLKKKDRRWFTRCFGPCEPGTTCSCAPTSGPPARACWGLHLCTCEWRARPGGGGIVAA